MALLIIGIIRQTRKMSNFFNDFVDDLPNAAAFAFGTEEQKQTAQDRKKKDRGFFGNFFKGVALTAICFLLGLVLTTMGAITGVVAACR